MSRTFYIACPETKQRLWIGQGTTDDMNTFYSNNKQTIACLSLFFNFHLGKPLVVVDSEDTLFDQLDFKDWCEE